MNGTERRMWFLGIWTKSVIGIRRTNERRPYHDENGKRVKSMGFVWMSCRGTLDALWFNRAGINRRRDLKLRRAVAKAVSNH